METRRMIIVAHVLEANKMHLKMMMMIQCLMESQQIKSMKIQILMIINCFINIMMIIIKKLYKMNRKMNCSTAI